MKSKYFREKFSILFSGIFFGILLGYASICCLVTAFDLHLFKTDIKAITTVSLSPLLLWCCLISILFSICYTWKLGALVPAFIFVYGLYLYFYGDLMRSIYALLYMISRRYNNVYSSGVILPLGSETAMESLTPVLRILCLIHCASMTWTVCRKQSSFWILACCIVYFVPCTVITTTVPETKYFFFLVVGIFLLLLTQWTRVRSQTQGTALILAFSIPVILCISLLFQYTPEEGYAGKARADKVLNKIQDAFALSPVYTPEGTGSSPSIDLTKVGYATNRYVPVMEVEASDTAIYYLRGRAYDLYTGTQWQDSGMSADLPWAGADDELTAETSRISITTHYTEDLIYLPYKENPAQRCDASFPQNAQENHDRLKNYVFSVAPYSDLPFVDSLDHESMQRYLRLPEHTLSWINSLPDYTAYMEEPSTLEESMIPMLVVKFLNEKAIYDLGTPPMSQDYNDFSQWFIEQSDTGYCVHFATTAAVLLRSLGIPSRYVTGYMIHTRAGKEVSVYEKNAHAWVEYWTADSGWKILEATPSALEPSESTSSTTAAESMSTEQAEATTIRPSTQTTEPSIEGETTGMPSAEAGNTQQRRGNRFLLIVLKWIGAMALLLGLVYGQMRLRIRLRLKARRNGTRNEQALCCWKQAKLYARRSKQKPDRKLFRVAEKAKFSQHTINAEELKLFDAYFTSSVQALRKKAWYGKLVDRLIFALY